MLLERYENASFDIDTERLLMRAKRKYSPSSSLCQSQRFCNEQAQCEIIVLKCQFHIPTTKRSHEYLS